MKKWIITALTFVFVVGAIGVGFALEPTGNDRKGKYTYRKVYKACMARGEVDSTTPPISPIFKTQAEWTRVFEARDFAQFGCAPEWEMLADEDLLDIYTYLHNHASDSSAPARCK